MTAHEGIGRRLLAGTVVAVLVLTLCTGRLFLFPATDSPRPSAAVVALAGDAGERLRTAVGLVREGVAPTLVVSFVGTPPAVCSGDWNFEVFCFQPDPVSTRGEARELARLVSARGWERIAVVTSPHHVFRANLLVRQCVRAEVLMIPAPRSHPPLQRTWAVLREWVALLAGVTVARAC